MAGRSRSRVSHIKFAKGTFTARYTVPPELREIVGVRELTRVLGPDRVKAERALPGVLGEFYARVDAARAKLAPVVTIPVERVSPIEMARILYDEEIERDERERNAISITPFTLFEAGYTNALRRTASGEAQAEEMDAVIGWAIDDFRRRGLHNETFGKPQWRLLARTLARAELEFVRRQSALDRGEAPPSPADPVVQSPASPQAPVTSASPAPSGPGVAGSTRMTDLFKAYVKERQVGGEGYESEKRWEPVFKNIYRYMKSIGKEDDACILTKADFIGWKESLIASGLSMKTIKDVYLASVKAVLRWAHENDRIENNPAATVRVKVPKRQSDREQGHRLEEAKAILKAALDHRPVDTGNPQTTESAYITAAKKWVPWLAAHTGARVAEVTQLRKQDVVTKNGIVCVFFTPDAGSVKSKKFRYVPLHKQIIDLGFLDFVAKSEGALFYDESTVSDAKAHRSKAVAGRISQWQRKNKLGAPNVQPNHGWRHRFKTLARELGADPRVVDAIQDHTVRTASDAYGDTTVLAQKNIIDRMPYYDVK